jgi:alpha-L-fucosidase
MNEKRVCALRYYVFMAWIAGFFVLCGPVKNSSQKYQPTWSSLEEQTIPEWFLDGKFGIYTHWGVYSVPAFGPNGTWYSHWVYFDENSPQRKYHESKYGPLEKFGYKDFIPMFRAEKFNAEEWADLFAKSGARWAGPVAEHHDGYAMWNTRFNDYNSVKMGPKRDIVGELEKAIKKRGMKFVTTFHHETNWWFFPTWDSRYDCGDAKYSDLYGPIHQRGAEPTSAYLDEWYGKIIEVIDNYDPDLIWFDTGLGAMRESYRKRFLAYYFNRAVQRQKKVVVAYKGNDLPPGIGVVDLELAQMKQKTNYPWMTDTSVDDQGAWSYVQGAKYKSVDRLVDNFVDIVSKNGCLLLNVGPKADGTIPEEAKECLLGIGRWLQVNGEAIYATRPWTTAGEGPTSLKSDKNFNNESGISYTAKDFRFTTKDNNLYAICLDWPGEQATIHSITTTTFPDEDFVGIYPSEIQSISMLGDGNPLEWKVTDEGLIVKTPLNKPCDYAYAFKIVLEK